MSEPAIREAILAATGACAPGRSVSPSDVAQSMTTENWQSLLARIRREAGVMAREGLIDILRKGKPVDPQVEFRGVIRLRARA